MNDTAECKNTDRELWRGPDEGNGSYYADSIHMTEGGGIGIDVGGRVIVMPLRDWHALAVISREAVPEDGLINGAYPRPVEHYARVARNLAAVWSNGNDGARVCILAELLRAASRPVVSDELDLTDDELISRCYEHGQPDYVRAADRIKALKEANETWLSVHGPARD